MNSEQLETWLIDLGQRITSKASPVKHVSSTAKHSEGEHRGFLKKEQEKTRILINYFLCNVEQIDLVHPLIGHLLAIYYKFGTGRYFTLQFIPGLIHLYLSSLYKEPHAVTSMLETLFLAIYNEEILAEGPGSENYTKRVDLVRVPSTRYPSIYHDPNKLNTYPELTEMRLNSNNATLCSVQVGPYPAIEQITGENRFLVLTRLIMAINSSLPNMVSEVICPQLCQMINNIACSGFNFKESNFRHRFLEVLAVDEVFPDLFGQPRIFAPSFFYIETLTIVNFCIFNGYANHGLRALDAIHQRGIFDVAPDILLVTNSMRDLLNTEDSCALIIELEKNR